MKSAPLYITLWLCVHAGYPQIPHAPEFDPEQISEEFLTAADEDRDYEDIYDNLVQTLSSPLDLNTVTPEELRSLNLLTDAQIDSFIGYRTEQAVLLDVHELQVIPGFDFEIISKVLPFVQVVNPADRINKSLFDRMFSPGHSYLITRYERTIEKRKGFQRSGGSVPAYAGSEDKLYFRVRSSIPGDFSLGITGEKDPGEKLTFDPRQKQWAFDFTSWHLQLRNKGKIKNFIVGDFQTQFAQGLMLGGAFGLGKGGESVGTIRKSSTGFQPYTSIDEGAYQRGAGLTIQPMPALELSAFYSFALRDASAGNNSDSSRISNLQSTGYHRTVREMANRKKISERNAAFVLNLKTKRTEAGAIVNHLHFGKPILPTSTLYNQFAFRGRTNLNAGIFLNHRIENISFFSEAAHSAGGGWGVLCGTLIIPHKNAELSVLYRNYMRNFRTFYSNAFSENTSPQNERGIYWGWKYSWNRKYTINGYVDLFDFPWLSFRRYRPSQGYEWLVRTTYKPSRKITISLQWREETKAENFSEMSTLYRVENIVKHRIFFQGDFGMSDAIRLKSRIQYNASHKGERTTEGWAFVQDLIFTGARFQVSARHALFDTDHYDNRHYVYESDAWLAYSLPAYSGVGVRNYVLFEYKINKIVTFWLRYARTVMLTGGEIGSGPDAIDGNTKNDVKFQARLKF